MELHELTASESAALIALKQVSPVELTNALLRRIDELDPQLQAWETVDREGALAAARRREMELFTPGATIGPLHGVPIGVKDIFFTAGLRTTASFAPLADFVPEEDATAVASLREAGAIILGKTVTTQFAFSDPPRTKNPWNANRTPGGSSSGSGAAVAARMVPAALGTQTSGSTLRPAAYCGCIGFKPSFGRISRHAVFPLSWSLDNVGIIARSVADAALLLQCMAGYDPRDSGSVDEELPFPLLSATSEDPAPRLGISMDFLDRAHPEVRAHLLDNARRLADAGAQITEVRLPADLSLILAVQQIIMEAEGGAVHAGQLATHADSYGPVLRAYVEVGQLIPSAAYVHAQRLRRKLRKEVEALMADFDCLMMPTVTNVAPDPSTTGDRTFQAPWALFGLPAISLPTGLNSEGLPIGTQIVAARFREDMLLQTAAWCAEVLGGLSSPV